MHRLTLALSAFLLPALAGCTAPSAAPGATALDADGLILAGVVDEADALAWSAQIEGSALELLLGRAAQGGPPAGTAKPDREDLLREPAARRGTPVNFTGRLVMAEKLVPGEECAKLGALHRGVILAADGKPVAFVSRAERPPLMEAVGADARIPVPLPELGKPVRVTGCFMKRWAALAPTGRDYLSLPLVAAGKVELLSGADADALAGVKMPAGPVLKPIPVPEVWRRPVVEIHSSGAMRLDGKPTAAKAIEEALAPEAARLRNPLGDSALALVVLAEPGVPAAAAESVQRIPALLGIKCVWRGPAPAKRGAR